MTKLAFLSGGTGGIGSATKSILESSGWVVIAPSRSILDFNSSVSVKDYLWANPQQSFDAIIFSHGEWFSKPLSEHQELDYLMQYRQRVLHPLRVFGAYSGLVNHGCAVIMVASTRGFMGGKETAPYSLACAAQIAWIQGMAKEYNVSGTRFNVVCPGLTNTKMGKVVRATGGCKPDAVAQDPRAVAGNIVMLAESSDANGMVVRVVDGVASEAKWSW